MNGRDEAALACLNEHYGRAFTLDDLGAEFWRRNYGFRQRASREETTPRVRPEEARLLVAQDAGYASSDALTRPGRRPRATPHSRWTSPQHLSARRVS